VKKIFFSKSVQNWRSHIFATKRPIDKIKHFLEMSFLWRSFIFVIFLFKSRFQGKIVVLKLYTTVDFVKNTFFSKSAELNLRNETIDRKNKTSFRNVIPLLFFHILLL
jgi:hypothetical protein